MKKKGLQETVLPKVAAAAVVIREGRVLLIKRAHDPSRGMWAVPGGSVRPGETLQAAAERETREETGLIIKAGEPIHVFDLIEREAGGRLRFHYVIIDMRADYIRGRLRAGDDAVEARWAGPDELGRLAITPGTLNLLGKIGFAPGGPLTRERSGLA